MEAILNYLQNQEVIWQAEWVLFSLCEMLKQISNTALTVEFLIVHLEIAV